MIVLVILMRLAIALRIVLGFLVALLAAVPSFVPSLVRCVLGALCKRLGTALRFVVARTADGLFDDRRPSDSFWAATALAAVLAVIAGHRPIQWKWHLARCEDAQSHGKNYESLIAEQMGGHERALLASARRAAFGAAGQGGSPATEGGKAETSGSGQDGTAKGGTSGGNKGAFGAGFSPVCLPVGAGGGGAGGDAQQEIDRCRATAGGSAGASPECCISFARDEEVRKAEVVFNTSGMAGLVPSVEDAGGDLTAGVAFHRQELARLAAVRDELAYRPHPKDPKLIDVVRPAMPVVAVTLLIILLHRWLDGQRVWAFGKPRERWDAGVPPPHDPNATDAAAASAQSRGGDVYRAYTTPSSVLPVFVALLCCGVHFVTTARAVPVKWWTTDSWCHSPAAFIISRAAVTVGALWLAISYEALWQMGNQARAILHQGVEKRSQPPIPRGKQPGLSQAVHALEFLRRTPPRLFVLLCGPVVVFTTYSRYAGVLVAAHRSSYLLAFAIAFALWALFLWRTHSAAVSVQDHWINKGRLPTGFGPEANGSGDPVKALVDHLSTDLLVYVGGSAATLWAVLSGLQLDAGLGLK